MKFLLTVDEILAMPEAELASYGEARLHSSLYAAEVQLNRYDAELQLVRQDDLKARIEARLIEHKHFPDEAALDAFAAFEVTCLYYKVCRVYDIEPTEYDRLWFCSDWATGEYRDRGDRVEDLLFSKGLPL